MAFKIDPKIASKIAPQIAQKIASKAHFKLNKLKGPQSGTVFLDTRSSACPATC